MNRLTIIGNVTKDPETRTTQTGKTVCSFTVAVNRRRKAEGQPDADFFRVSAWNSLADICAKYLEKGKKVCVEGSVSVSTYTGNDGATRANLEVLAQDVEFISPRSVQQEATQEPVKEFKQVEVDDLPWEV